MNVSGAPTRAIRLGDATLWAPEPTTSLPPGDVPTFSQPLTHPDTVGRSGTIERRRYSFISLSNSPGPLEASHWHSHVHGFLEVAHLHIQAVLNFQRNTFKPAGRTPPTAAFPPEVKKPILVRI